ncbi:hypothetical protein VC623_22785 [Citrobacter amalonaticus]|uniref:hypothetical protein n=1 Tax=Citrobacter amalonaticus TaxID=35703 RepID=UPI00292BBE82|nr:hypothetical protein [Citrobacter amalonaticus]MDV0787436.1 hypothetical protein [Citrobacter amalonaticus]MEB0643500.1 hypothetical protein [Citrobacter amalonaticus]
MRDEERNNTLLAKMRVHIAEWEARRPTPEGYKYCFFWLATFIGVLVATVSVFHPSLFALCFLITWFFLSQKICKRIVPRYNERWEEVFDRMLSAYEPLNLPAWEYLKRQVETEGLTVSIVRNWYHEESMTVWPKKNPDWKFLRNSPYEENNRKENET